ncbi:uncharacterized protein TNCV_255031 [Trichonephila clavipes]|nr:uncharacterized protein TNCV_255031 [Trichonephila clavipes]
MDVNKNSWDREIPVTAYFKTSTVVPATRGLLVTDHVILNHGQVTWTTPELAPPLLTTTPHQQEDVSALDRFNVHRCPTRRVFSGTGLEPVTKQATVRYLYHLATAAARRSRSQSPYCGSGLSCSGLATKTPRPEASSPSAFTPSQASGSQKIFRPEQDIYIFQKEHLDFVKENLGCAATTTAKDALNDTALEAKIIKKCQFKILEYPLTAKTHGHSSLNVVSIETL